MTDRELLEAAAKAAGMTSLEWNDGGEPYSSGQGFVIDGRRIWNPLYSDGDALRLVVKLKLHIGLESHTVSAWESDKFGNFQTENFIGRDENDATRRAIVRAAAAIGANK